VLSWRAPASRSKHKRRQQDGDYLAGQGPPGSSGSRYHRRILASVRPGEGRAVRRPAHALRTGNPGALGRWSCQTPQKAQTRASWDVTGGQKYWYLSLAGQPGHVYVGTVASVGPALVLAHPGDPVTISALNTGSRESSQTMQSFTDARVPLHIPGS
jgi:hypothetical protein